MMIGTPLFMEPEQFSGVSVDHRADLFSLGSVLYTLCAGKTPFRGESVLVLMKQVSTATPVPLRSARPDAPAWLVNVINKLLAKLPASRYQTAAEVVQAFAKQAG
jgi:serine/threonine-protein kinase